MENPGFVSPSNLILPNLGTTDRKAKKVKYIRDIEDIITLPAITEDVEKGQVMEKNLRPTVKKDLVSKRWYRLEIGLTFVNFMILLAFFSASMCAIYYINHPEKLQKTLLEKMPELFQKGKPMSEDLKPILEDMKNMLVEMNDDIKSTNEEMIALNKSMKDDMTSMKEDMKSMKEDMKSMNEEMKSMNEEMMKKINEEMKIMNDEMKSMNEEMKLMKEDMKSMNEAIIKPKDSDVTSDQQITNSTSIN